ncbi:glycosyltransferase family 2 protein [Empedobacter falsenii]
MNQPLVSIIATFYNSGDFVHSAMKSLLNQTYQNIEFVCVNDGSTDDTLYHLNEYKSIDNRIVLIDKPNEGALHFAFAEAQKHVKGKYVMTFDHDDELSLNAIEEAVKVMEGNLELDMSLFKVLYIDENKVIKESKKQPEKILSGIEGVEATIGRFKYSFRCFYKTEIFNSVSFYFEEKWPNYDEYLGRVLISKCNKIGTNQGIYYYKWSLNSITTTISFKKIKHLETHILLMKELVIKLDLYNSIKERFEQSIFEKLNFYYDLYIKQIDSNNLKLEEKKYALDLFKRCYHAIDENILIKNNRNILYKIYLRILFLNFNIYAISRRLK